jgi:uncharacterized protein involved in type VI secretion and phage assembly
MPIEIPQLPVTPEPAPTSPHPQAAQSRRDVEPRAPRPAIRAVPSARWYGVYPALVRDNRDPEGLGRVKVRLPWAPDAGGMVGIEKGRQDEAWARLATLIAGHNRGSWFLPDINDEVLVTFEAGNPSRPVVVGALWNGQDAPPVTADADNTIKMLRTRGGSEVRFNDQAGDEAVEIRTAAGQSISLTSAGGGRVVIKDGHSNTVTLTPKGITIETPSNLQLTGSTITLDAGIVHVNAGMVKCSGVLQSETLITNSVVAATYTPGAGNIW